MRVTDWLIRNRDAAATTWLTRDRFARQLDSVQPHADMFRAHATKARRRLAWWDFALGVWTRGGTRRR